MYHTITHITTKDVQASGLNSSSNRSPNHCSNTSTSASVTGTGSGQSSVTVQVLRLCLGGRPGNGHGVIKQCCACQATVIMKVQIGEGLTITGESFAKGIGIQGTIWRPITDPDTIGVVKVVWLDSNPKRAVLHLLGMARNMAGGGSRVSTGGK